MSVIISRGVVIDGGVSVGLGSEFLGEELSALGVDDVDERDESKEGEEGHDGDDDNHLRSEAIASPLGAIDLKPSAGAFAGSKVIGGGLADAAHAVGARRTLPEHKLGSSIVAKGQNTDHVGHRVLAASRRSGQVDNERPLAGASGLRAARPISKDIRRVGVNGTHEGARH